MDLRFYHADGRQAFPDFKESLAILLGAFGRKGLVLHHLDMNDCDLHVTAVLASDFQKEAVNPAPFEVVSVCGPLPDAEMQVCQGDPDPEPTPSEPELVSVPAPDAPSVESLEPPKAKSKKSKSLQQ